MFGKLALGLMIPAFSLLANSASFAGYIQANSTQDFAFLSSNVGDNNFNVTFSSSGQVGFSYYAGTTQENATLNLVDASTFAGQMGVMGVLAGTFAIQSPSTPGTGLSGSLFILPPADYSKFSDVAQSTVASFIQGDSVIRISSLMPVIIYPGGCPYCGLMPLWGDAWNPDFATFEDVPEPGTFALFAGGLGLAVLVHRRRGQYFKPKP